MPCNEVQQTYLGPITMPGVTVLIVVLRKFTETFSRDGGSLSCYLLRLRGHCIATSIG